MDSRLRHGHQLVRARRRDDFDATLLVAAAWLDSRGSRRDNRRVDVRRDVIERLDGAAIGYFVTGSEAMAIHGLAYRATNDIDLVVRLDPAAYEARLRPAFEPVYLVNDPIRIGQRWLGAVIHVTAVGKADLVMRDADPWGESAFARRVRVEDPALGMAWVSSIEDLLLAKLEFADGDQTGLQARDCRRIVVSSPGLDRAYVRAQAIGLRLTAFLEDVLADAH
jgi:hypothetical protein